MSLNSDAVEAVRGLLLHGGNISEGFECIFYNYVFHFLRWGGIIIETRKSGGNN